MAAALLLRLSTPDQVADYDQVVEPPGADLESQPGDDTGEALLITAIELLGKSVAPEARALPGACSIATPIAAIVARAIAEHPTEADIPYLMRSLQARQPATLQISLRALQRLNYRPDTPTPIRTAILAGLKLGDQGSLAAASLLRRWTGVPHPGGTSPAEALAHYQRWFADRYPDEPAPELPQVDVQRNRHDLSALLALLEQGIGVAAIPSAAGPVRQGRLRQVPSRRVGGWRRPRSVGPATKIPTQGNPRFDSLSQPVISDQFRSVTVVTTDGLIHTGLPLPQPARATCAAAPRRHAVADSARQDRRAEPSRISVMPEGLLNPLTLDEIADLFAYLETTRSAALESPGAGAIPSAVDRGDAAGSSARPSSPGSSPAPESKQGQP